MMKKRILQKKYFSLFLSLLFLIACNSKNEIKNEKQNINNVDVKEKNQKKSLSEKKEFSEKRLEHELSMQRNPFTGKIPLEEKQLELENALKIKKNFSKSSSRTYISRGPSNFGGRTRAIRVDLSDTNSNTILSGGVSSGLFRTTNGGNSWVKVSPNDDIHNVTALAQDPRNGFQNIWYYATGERSGNSASLGSAYRGRGVWKSIDNGVTWSQIAATDSAQETFNTIDYIMGLEVSPINGDLMIAGYRTIYRYDGNSLTIELRNNSGGRLMTDLVINSQGRVFAAFEGNASTEEGVWTSPNGNGSWTRIAKNGTPLGWNATGRIVLANAPSNDNVIYALFENGNDNENGEKEADLWKYNLTNDTWTNYSSKLPDENGGDLAGNDPFSVQGGYDLVVSVKPDNENFVLIGGTGAYRIENIVNDATFTRIGGYASLTYANYVGDAGTDEHHADIHELLFNPHNFNQLFSGTDGGIHKSENITATTVSWKSLNNNYITYQFYHVAMDPLNGSDIVFGGAQDNGTNRGGVNAGLPNNTEMNEYYGGDGVAVGIARRANFDLQYYYGSQNGKMRTNKPSFRNIKPDGSESQFVTYFYLDQDNNKNLYYAGKSTLYKTNDSENITSATWENLGKLDNVNENIVKLSATRGTYNASSSYLLIGGRNGTILRLDDPQNATGNATLSSANNISPTGFPVTSGSAVVTGLAIHPTNPDIVLATYSNYGIENIFLTSNATAASPTWSMVERNLNVHSIRSAAITEINGQVTYFVGTARGLYSSTNPISIDWTLEGGSQIGLPLVSDLVYRVSDNRLVIGTHGNGMFQTTIQTLSADDYAKNNLSFSVYPNPVVNELKISSSNLVLNEAKFKVIDINGKVIKKGNLDNTKLDVHSLNSGVYILEIENNGLRNSVKFIKS